MSRGDSIRRLRRSCGDLGAVTATDSHLQSLRCKVETSVHTPVLVDQVIALPHLARKRSSWA